MKIGILTFHKSKNYGSVLQAFALYSFLESKGYDVRLLDFVPESQNIEYALFKPNKSIANVLGNVITLFDYRFLKKKYDSFVDFSNRLKMTNVIVTKDDINKEKLDMIIVGSDQVWNVNVHDFNEMFFLPDINVKKITYAISMGKIKKIENAINNETIEYIKQFDLLSTREKTTSEFLAHATGRNISCVMDPTFLVPKTKWSDMAGQKSFVNGEYLVVYSIEYYNDVISVVDKLTDLYKMKVLFIYSCKKSYKCLMKGWKRNRNCSPTDFLNYIKYARFVISSSFHGCVFSLIFEKQFLAVERVVNGCVEYEDRIRTLLEKLDLENYIINPNYDFLKFDYKKIDYGKINNLLESEIELSRQYLDYSLEEKNENL